MAPLRSLRSEVGAQGCKRKLTRSMVCSGGSGGRGCVGGGRSVWAGICECVVVKGWSVTEPMFCLSMDVYSTFKEKIIWPLL